MLSFFKKHKYIYWILITIIAIFIGLIIISCGNKLLENQENVTVFATPQLPTANGNFNLAEVNNDNLQTLLKKMSGYLPVDIDGTSTLLTERYSPSAKANYRKFWLQYFKNLGIPINELPYTTSFHRGETQGHNMEAVLEGSSPDSIVIVVHYDSIGTKGQETKNPGVDDNMTGMAIMLETARILASKKEFLHYTVRFVATDYEEEDNPNLEGARKYAAYIKNKSETDHFKIIAAIGPDQTGWNCFAEAACQDDSTSETFDIFSCSDDGENFNANGFGEMFTQFVSEFSTLQVEQSCTIDDSDVYAMWEIGIPSLIYVEHNPHLNPNYDENGTDALDKVDLTYHASIAQVSSAFIARLAGIDVTK
jgi:Zn-dependent M28 family amino/carboxypeptidase